MTRFMAVSCSHKAYARSTAVILHARRQLSEPQSCASPVIARYEGFEERVTGKCPSPWRSPGHHGRENTRKKLRSQALRGAPSPTMNPCEDQLAANFPRGSLCRHLPTLTAGPFPRVSLRSGTHAAIHPAGLRMVGQPTSHFPLQKSRRSEPTCAEEVTRAGHRLVIKSAGWSVRRPTQYINIRTLVRHIYLPWRSERSPVGPSFVMDVRASRDLSCYRTMVVRCIHWTAKCAESTSQAFNVYRLLTPDPG
jgi:hypothetical protein